MDEMEQEFLAEGLDTIHEGELVIAPNGTALVRQDPMQQIRTRYVTAMAVQEPRNLTLIEKRLCQEASLLGERAFYAWTVKDRKTGKTTLISGDSINLAMAAIRCFGNCVVDQDPPIETKEAWFYTIHVIDLERGFTHTRTGRYGRGAVVYGDYDHERQERIRYEIGQSMSIRNAIDDVVPKWLMDQAIKHAKGGVRKRLEDYITKNGIDKARDILIGRLMEKGITQERLLAKMSRPTLMALTLDDLVIMQGDAKQLEDNADVVENLYPEVEPSSKSQTGLEPAASPTEPPKSRTQELTQQLTQRRPRADRTKRAEPADVYVGRTQMDELWALVGARGMPEAYVSLFDHLRTTDTPQVTPEHYQAVREALLARPLLVQETGPKARPQVYMSADQQEELSRLANDRGVQAIQAVKDIFRGDPEKVTVKQYEDAKAHLLTQPVLDQWDETVEYGPDRDVDPLPREDE